ncbi:hypothetical protein [Pelosinus sp. IPA-1]|uniref:hypothetical protein n=1 Tax=Pelosinus sp. IPA-1 TaxID=3029569 RepID=UPI00243617D1|nr:hypothetical protein [Pelosinus sp. IPA-1]GMB00401.1 hypothetical protein PIPA1_32000 [Pelosinus sp. IPA-1]
MISEEKGTDREKPIMVEVNEETFNFLKGKKQKQDHLIAFISEKLKNHSSDEVSEKLNFALELFYEVEKSGVADVITTIKVAQSITLQKNKLFKSSTTR